MHAQADLCIICQAVPPPPVPAGLDSQACEGKGGNADNTSRNEICFINMTDLNSINLDVIR